MAKVLLVEDDNNLREIYEARLQAEGYTIVSARDGEEALVIAKNEQPDLVISDVMMPKISGFEMLDILRNTAGMQDVKVIMLTALGQADDQARANKLGADRYLVKSQVTLEDIVKTAHDILGDTQPAATNTSPSQLSAPSPQPTNPELMTVETINQASSQTSPTTTPETPPVQPPATPLETATPEPANSPATEQSTATSLTAPIVQISPSATSSNDAQSTAQEESTVEEQIQSFIAKQPAQETPSANTVPTQTSQSNALEDDKILSDAVNTLVTEGETNTVSIPPPADQVVVEPPSPTDSTDTQLPPVTLTNQTETTGQGNGATIAHKKIIQPLESEAKTPLDTLVAMEAAKDTATSPINSPPAPTVTDNLTQPTLEQQPSQSQQEQPHQPGHIITPDQTAPATTEEAPGFEPSHIAL
ncbi:MAG TPA: response regulator [Candidatus Dormibacteraeota bacterium]|nr:response regulator [Candidatus Dormibacteraeota bacterium]